MNAKSKILMINWYTAGQGFDSHWEIRFVFLCPITSIYSKCKTSSDLPDPYLAAYLGLVSGFDNLSSVKISKLISPSVFSSP